MKIKRPNNSSIFYFLFTLLLIVGGLSIVFSSQITSSIYGKCYSGSNKIEVLKFIAQIIGGLAIVFGLFISNWRAKSIEDNLRITEDGNITERFNQAITNMANSELTIRLGGIYALHRIAIKSEYDKFSVFEIFCSYIRQKNTIKQGEILSLEFDSQVILDLLFKNKDDIYSSFKANLSGIFLNGANFSNSKLILVDFSNSVIINSNFNNSQILFSKFINTRLSNSDFYNARFTTIYFSDAIIDNCGFYDAIFENFNDISTKLTVDQLKTTKTLLDCKGIPDEMLKELKLKYSYLFDFDKIKKKK